MIVIGCILVFLGGFSVVWGAMGVLDRHTYSEDDRPLLMLGVLASIAGTCILVFS